MEKHVKWSDSLPVYCCSHGQLHRFVAMRPRVPNSYPSIAAAIENAPALVG